jgi:16S rRNA (uracil1498-N3)-methyltransferase
MSCTGQEQKIARLAAGIIFRPNSAMPHCRIYLDLPPHASLEVGHEAAIPADQAHYLLHVMRLTSGDPLTIFDGCGGEYRAIVSGLTKQGGSCDIEKFIDIDRELPIRIHVIQCANKSDKIETVLQKCTELGAASFQIANSERSQFKLPDKKLGPRLERWQKIVIEAAEQSERTAMPTVTWRPSLQNIEICGMAFALHPQSAIQWQQARSEIARTTDITLAIGPEGGWSRRDLESLEKLGFNNLTFGTRIMRTETAAPALLAAIQAVLD